MTLSSLNLSFLLCQMSICDILRGRLHKTLRCIRISPVLQCSPVSFTCRQKCSLQTVWYLPAETVSLVRTRHGGPGGACIAPPHMCSFLRSTMHISFCSQPRCFWWKTFFFLFLVTFALIFIRKPVGGLPLSITQLLLLEFKNVYHPHRPVCVSPLMNWTSN